jgi:hypothetical protein
MLVSPIRRAAIPLATAAAVLTITFVQVAIIVWLGALRGADFSTSVTRLPWSRLTDLDRVVPVRTHIHLCRAGATIEHPRDPGRIALNARNGHGVDDPLSPEWGRYRYSSGASGPAIESAASPPRLPSEGLRAFQRLPRYRAA